MGFEEKFSLRGKSMIITGASKGIGAGVAGLMAELGVRLYLAARGKDALEGVCAAIREKGGEACPYTVDLRNVADIRRCVDKIARDQGKIDILFNNAGMGKPIPALDLEESDWDEMMDLNLKGMFFFSQAVAKKMAATGGGKIINMSSQASVAAISGETIYCASKAGVNQMTKVLAYEWAGKKITVNAIGPTFVYTPGTAERLDDPAFRAEVLKNIPLGRVCSMEDVAGTVAFLASPASDMLTGDFILIDGGWTIT
ncbi:MAG: SDR family oxidoreductase [Oscillospiraceae bacterium]|jgi:NAD(P)-dependent dehydrogenase (short-subunit alcohol dehydrogenase family)|nr:SDR family oxidoreductase [Oscillospiraceae bacterium]